MQVTGSCYCRQVRFKADVRPETSTVCHCTDCQKLSGSPWRLTVFAPAEGVSVEGKVKTFIKTADSGRKRLHAFCPECGSAIYACGVENPDTYGFRVGLIDQREQLPPTRQIWCDSALKWSEDISGLQRYAKGV